MATSGKDWRKAREEGIELKFPSGAVARIRPIDVDFFVRVGRVPNVMASIIADLIEGEPTKMEKPPMERLEDQRDWLDFLNQLVSFAFVSPKVVDVPQADDEIALDDLTYADKFLVYQLFAQPAEVLRSFRDKQEQSLAALAVPKNNGATPKPLPGPEALVKPVAGDA